MSSNADPLARFDANYISDTMYTEDINKKMRVPKRIRVASNSDDDMANGLSGHWSNYDNNYPTPDEQFDMKVPERIIVTGSGQHVGTKTLPREIVLEDQVMPRDPGVIRVATPPRVITLDKYHYPSVKDPPNDEPSVPVVKPRSRFNTTDKGYPSSQDADDFTIVNSSFTSIGHSGGDGLTPAEEILHLRKQLAKLNRRVMAIELESMQRQQKEKFIYGLGLAYFLFKALLWLNRS
ncbi:transport and Golgi organization protein 11 isoform X2 [Chrysoperla carnea]|uniref:transport and Golgi organization protein 11 isoform X2 n=1 Tax=Chrysoperla carnea TaxID=189513 RepID=UPI001D09325F|nr:transport and Golgi organization protein 11 isoform X2 [Chrysoperla carnea]